MISLRMRICERIRRNGERYFKTNYFTGNCGYMSIALKLSFIREGIPAKLCRGRFKTTPKYDIDHCWVESNGNIYDLTAEQFNYKDISFPKIFVCSNRYNRYLVYTSIMTYDNAKIAEFMEWDMESFINTIPSLVRK